MPFNWRKLHDASQEDNDNKRWRAELTALVLGDEETREEGRRVTQSNLLALCWVLGYCRVDEKVHHDALAFFPPKNSSLSLDDWIIETNARYKRIGSLLLPRGVYKTTISLCNCVQLIICWPLNVSVMIMCGRGDLAHDFVDQVARFFVKRNYQTPTLFQALWPELCITRQQDSGKFTAALRQTDPPIIEPTLWGESIEAGTSGYHPNILITDDIHTNRNSQTSETRANVTQKYKLAKKVLLPIGMEVRIGTTYGVGDIFSDEILSYRPGKLRRVIKPAMRLKSGERLDQNGFPDEDEVELLFPTILNYEFLLQEYETGWESFATQYLLDEYGSAEVVFTQDELLRAMVEETALPLEGQTFIHWRFPCQRRNWKTAAAAIGIVHRNRCYIVEVIEGHYKPSVLSKLVVNTARKYSQHRISVEDAPGARLLTSAINNYAITTGWNIGMDWIGEDMAEEDSGERDLRIRNLEAELSTGRLLFNAGMKHLKALMLEFSQYSMIPNYAIPDCVSRVTDHLPQSIAAEDLEDEDAAWKQMMERDHFNLIYGRGKYAPPEPEPEEVEQPDPADEKFNEFGLEVIIPGLE